MSAEQIVDAIIADIEGRSGLGDEWAQIDPDIQAEIRAQWIDIANTPLGHAVPGLHEAYVAKNESEAERRYAMPAEHFDQKAEEAADAEAEAWDAMGLSPHDWGDR